MDFLADLSALKVIETEEVARARPDNTRPIRQAVLHDRRSDTPFDKKGSLLEEFSSGNSYGSIEVSSLH